MVGVVALVVPGEVHEGRGDRFHAAPGEGLPEDRHVVIVVLGEGLVFPVASDGPRVLPEVEQEFPVRRFRQHAVDDADADGPEVVHAGSGVFGHAELQEGRSAIIVPAGAAGVQKRKVVDEAVVAEGDLRAHGGGRVRDGGEGHAFRFDLVIGRNRSDFAFEVVV